jgi:superfamily II DNA/RNA helicase
MVLDEFDKSLQLGFHEQMSFIIGKLSKLNKRIVSATQILRYQNTRVVNPTILDFIPETKKKLTIYETGCF